MGDFGTLIPLFKPFIAPRDELMPALERVLYSGYIAEGEAVADFEEAFGKYIGNPNCVAVSSCTAALHIALLLANVKGYRVFTTPMTAEPTNLSILYANAIPSWCDVDPYTGNLLCTGALASKQVGAIMAVDYGGIPVRMSWSQLSIPVIEDAAHAIGAVRDGRMVGNDADFTCFSFQAIKHLTTGEGGMLVCKRADDVPRARRLRWFGIDRTKSRETVDVTEVGFKYNMNNITATMGMVQLKHLPWVLEQHRSNARFFSKELFGVRVVTEVPASDTPSFWFLTLLTPNADGLRIALQDHNIQSTKIHRRNDEHSIFQYAKKSLPYLDKFCSEAVHIPCGWWLTDENRERIVRVVNRWSKSCSPTGDLR